MSTPATAQSNADALAALKNKYATPAAAPAAAPAAPPAVEKKLDFLEIEKDPTKYGILPGKFPDFKAYFEKRMAADKESIQIREKLEFNKKGKFDNYEFTGKGTEITGLVDFWTLAGMQLGAMGEIRNDKGERIFEVDPDKYYDQKIFEALYPEVVAANAAAKAAETPAAPAPAPAKGGKRSRRNKKSRKTRASKKYRKTRRHYRRE